MLEVVEVRHLHDFVLWLRFDDRIEGEVDLRDALWGEVFEPMLAVDQFRRVSINPETGTIEWPNGADLAPEYLKARLRAAAS
jgi:hypothetical protein